MRRFDDYFTANPRRSLSGGQSLTVFRLGGRRSGERDRPLKADAKGLRVQAEDLDDRRNSNTIPQLKSKRTVMGKRQISRQERFYAAADRSRVKFPVRKPSGNWININSMRKKVRRQRAVKEISKRPLAMNLIKIADKRSGPRRLYEKDVVGIRPLETHSLRRTQDCKLGAAKGSGFRRMAASQMTATNTSRLGPTNQGDAQTTRVSTRSSGAEKSRKPISKESCRVKASAINSALVYHCQCNKSKRAKGTGKDLVELRPLSSPT